MHRLEQLIALPGLAGREDAVIAFMREALAPLADEVSVDWLGNVIARIGQASTRPRVMVFAHMDTLGLLVRKIEPDGFLRVQRLGGVPEKALQAQRMLVHGRHGAIAGLVGSRSHHLTPVEDKIRGLTVDQLYLDIGAGSRQAALAMGVQVGSGVTYAPQVQRLGVDGLCGTYLDNRAGCWTLLRLAERLHSAPVPPTVYIVATVQEEFNLQGALPVAKAIQPDLALCLDIALATDTPELKEQGEVKLGAGPVIQTYTFHGRGTLAGLLPNPKLVDYVTAVADEAGIPTQFGVTLGALTDASYLHLAGGRGQPGTPALDLGFPTRYTHSPVESCSLRDLDWLLNLLYATLGSLTQMPDLRRG
ncbi:MAG TPA: M42 family metallopeptidase [Caldilineaceae bacterium]|nr:M42 family metallopeptidase [Caldilineaceae bacterium]